MGRSFLISLGLFTPRSNAKFRPHLSGLQDALAVAPTALLNTPIVALRCLRLMGSLGYLCIEGEELVTNSMPEGVSVIVADNLLANE
jgi:hypothetical protein